MNWILFFINYQQLIIVIGSLMALLVIGIILLFIIGKYNQKKLVRRKNV